MRGEPPEYPSWQIVDERDQIGKVTRAEHLADSLIQLLLGEPAIDEG